MQSPEWYGSLPDDFFYQMKTMPPLLHSCTGSRSTNIAIVNGQQLVKLCEMKKLPLRTPLRTLSAGARVFWSGFDRRRTASPLYSLLSIK